MACIGGPDYEVNAGAEFEVREQTCSCELNAEQEESLFQYAALNDDPIPQRVHMLGASAIELYLVP